jgi:hypothetical protein
LIGNSSRRRKANNQENHQVNGENNSSDKQSTNNTPSFLNKEDFKFVPNTIKQSKKYDIKEQSSLFQTPLQTKGKVSDGVINSNLQNNFDQSRRRKVPIFLENANEKNEIENVNKPGSYKILNNNKIENSIQDSNNVVDSSFFPKENSRRIHAKIKISNDK